MDTMCCCAREMQVKPVVRTGCHLIAIPSDLRIIAQYVGGRVVLYQQMSHSICFGCSRSLSLFRTLANQKSVPLERRQQQRVAHEKPTKQTKQLDNLLWTLASNPNTEFECQFRVCNKFSLFHTLRIRSRATKDKINIEIDCVHFTMAERENWCCATCWRDESLRTNWIGRDAVVRHEPFYVQSRSYAFAVRRIAMHAVTGLFSCLFRCGWGKRIVRAEDDDDDACIEFVATTTCLNTNDERDDCVRPLASTNMFQSSSSTAQNDEEKLKSESQHSTHNAMIWKLVASKTLTIDDSVAMSAQPQFAFFSFFFFGILVCVSSCAYELSH